jgi:hypothetical protein
VVWVGPATSTGASEKVVSQSEVEEIEIRSAPGLESSKSLQAPLFSLDECN